MPLYEYECFVCGHRFERIQKVSAEPIKTCPECAGSVRRLLGAPALQFKGSGWYVTDYGKGTGGVAGERKIDSKPTPAETAAASDSAAKSAPEKKTASGAKDSKAS